MAGPGTGRALDALLASFPGVDPPVIAEVFFARGGDAAAATDDLRELLGLSGPTGPAAAAAAAVAAQAEVDDTWAAVDAADAAAEAGRRERAGSASAGAASAAHVVSPSPALPSLPASTSGARQRQYWAVAPECFPPVPPPRVGNGLVPAMAGSANGNAWHRPKPPPLHQPTTPAAGDDPAGSLAFLRELFGAVEPGLVRDVLAMAGGAVGPAVEALLDLVGDDAGGGGLEEGEGGECASAQEEEERTLSSPGDNDPLAALFPSLPPAAIAAAREAAGGDGERAAARLAEEADARAAAALAADQEDEATRAAAAARAAALESEAAVTPANVAALAVRFPDLDDQALAGALRAAGRGGVEAAASFCALASGMEEAPPDPDARFVTVASTRKGGRARQAKQEQDAAWAAMQYRRGGVGEAPPPRALPSWAGDGEGAAGRPLPAAAHVPKPHHLNPTPPRPPRAPRQPALARPTSAAGTVPVAPGSFELPAPAMPAPFRSSTGGGGGGGGGGGARQILPGQGNHAAGDASIYGVAREQERALYEERKRVARAAKDAFLRGDRVAAAALRREVASLTGSAKAAADAAAHTIMATTNAGLHSLIALDLHFLHVGEATGKAAAKLRHLLDDPVSSTGRTVLRLIAGRGARSMASTARLMPALMAMLDGAGLAYEVGAAGGCLDVEVPPALEPAAVHARTALAAAMVEASAGGAGAVPPPSPPPPPLPVGDTSAFPGLVAAAERKKERARADAARGWIEREWMRDESPGEGGPQQARPDLHHGAQGYFCTVCGIDCTGPKQFSEHCAGRRHSENVAAGAATW